MTLAVGGTLNTNTTTYLYMSMCPYFSALEQLGHYLVRTNSCKSMCPYFSALERLGHYLVRTYHVRARVLILVLSNDSDITWCVLTM